jgi:hypothetical protein
VDTALLRRLPGATPDGELDGAGNEPAGQVARRRTRRPATLPLAPAARAVEDQEDQADTVEQPDWAAALAQAHDSALACLRGLPDRPVGSGASRPALLVALGGPLPEAPEDP